MEFRQHSEIQANKGHIVLLYGPTGCGKTVQALSTCPSPILVISGEKRNLGNTLNFVQSSSSMLPAPRKDLVIQEARPNSGFDDFMDFLSSPPNFRPAPGENNPDPQNYYRTILFDGLAHWLELDLKGEIAAQSFDAHVPEYRARKSLINSTKLDQECWGALAENGLRLLNALGVLSREMGHLCVVTCLGQDRPKYDRDLAYGPLFPGKKLSDIAPGGFDVIGRVSVRKSADGLSAEWPPQVDMVSPDDSFMAKMSGNVVGGPCQILHVSRMLGLEETAD
jgi:hypothetical protein